MQVTMAAAQPFLLALSALFSIVNPLGSALIFSQVTAGRTHAERVVLARRIGLYSAAVMLGALWAGSEVLAFFGVGLPALRIAGGAVVAANAWRLLNAPEHQEARKEAQAAPAGATPPGSAEDVAFFPLTMPFTTGPGTISVAVALGSNGPSAGPALVEYVVATSAAAIVIAASVALAYGGADRIVSLLGRGGTRVVSRLAAFLLLCVGAQIVLGGVADFVRGLR